MDTLNVIIHYYNYIVTAYYSNVKTETNVIVFHFATRSFILGHPEEVERTASKPSLFSTSGQVEASGNSILSDLENTGSTKAASSPALHKPRRMALMLTLVVLAAVATTLAYHKKPINTQGSSSTAVVFSDIVAPSKPPELIAATTTTIAIPTENKPAKSKLLEPKPAASKSTEQFPAIATVLATEDATKATGLAALIVDDPIEKPKAKYAQEQSEDKTKIENKIKNEDKTVSPKIASESSPKKESGFVKSVNTASVNAQENKPSSTHKNTSASKILAQNNADTTAKKHGTIPPTPAHAADQVIAANPTHTANRVSTTHHPVDKAKPIKLAALTRDQTADSDVALLSAIVAHDSESTAAPVKTNAKVRAGAKQANKAKAAEPVNTDIVERKPEDSTESLLLRCKQLGFLEGGLCRWRICSGRQDTDTACSTPEHSAKIPGMGG
jgi:hypothetical protein